MKVILLQEIKGQGGEGDVVEVKRGYAVNYLFPQKLATPANKGNLKQLELRKHNIAKRESERLDSADKIQAALSDKVLTIPARVGEEGQLFGSVTTQQIADMLKENLGVEIDRKKIDLHAPIKTAGEHSVTVSVYRDIKAVLTVNVVDENAGKEEEAAKEAAAVAAAADVVEAEELAEDAEALGLADKINETIEQVEADEKVAEIVEEADEALKDIADKLVQAADAEDTEEAEALGDAVAEVFRETEGVVDAAAADAIEEALSDEQ